MASMNLIKDMALALKQQDILTHEELQSVVINWNHWAKQEDFETSLRLALRRGIVVGTENGFELGRPMTPGVDYPRHPALALLGVLGLAAGIITVVLALNSELAIKQSVGIQLGIGVFVSGLLCLLRYVS